MINVKDYNFVYVGSFAWHCINTNIIYNDVDIWYHGSKPNICNIGVTLDYKELPKNIIESFNSTFPTLDELYTIKCSHLGWSNPMWGKHRQHILAMQKEGATIVPELYDKLTAYWKKELGNKEFLNLDKSKKLFFEDHVNYRFDHDYLHVLVAEPNKPIYESILKQNSEVLLCKDKFDLLPLSSKIKLFEEEIHAIALERWILNPYWLKTDLSIQKAHYIALQKTITNLTKNWACDFICTNLIKFIYPNYKTYYKVIDNLLSNKEKEKFMSNDNAIQYLETYLSEINLINTEGSLRLEEFIFMLCEDDMYFTGADLLKEKYEHLDSDGGGEGGSEDCYGIFKLGDKIFKAYYTYYSYNGHEYENIVDTLREVTPVQKTVTVYE
jgi:hypothetical protein